MRYAPTANVDYLSNCRMTYRFATEDRDYSDFAAGRVFHSLPGAFPVRLASEMFQRCVAIRERDGLTAPVTLYDPCCGSAYMLSTVAILHRDMINRVIGSDIDASLLSLAERNLSLLTIDGLDTRIAQINDLYRQHGKPSHLEALESANRLKQHIAAMSSQTLTTRLFAADALNVTQLSEHLNGEHIDIVMTDVPYDSHTAWKVNQSNSSPMWQLLDSLRSVLSSQAVVAICADKMQKAVHEGYSRVEQFQIGKRRVAILKPK